MPGTPTENANFIHESAAMRVASVMKQFQGEKYSLKLEVATYLTTVAVCVIDSVTVAVKPFGRMMFGS